MTEPHTCQCGSACACEGCGDGCITHDLLKAALPRIAELEGLLRELSLGQSIHNSRFPDRKIEGPLWDRVTAALKPPTT